MQHKTTTFDMVSVRDRWGSREAHNLFVDGLSETVRPWFADMEDEKVMRAIDELNLPSRRDAAAAYLGLQIQTVKLGY